MSPWCTLHVTQSFIRFRSFFSTHLHPTNIHPYMYIPNTPHIWENDTIFVHTKQHIYFVGTFMFIHIESSRKKKIPKITWKHLYLQSLLFSLLFFCCCCWCCYRFSILVKKKKWCRNVGLCVTVWCCLTRCCTWMMVLFQPKKKCFVFQSIFHIDIDR